MPERRDIDGPVADEQQAEETVLALERGDDRVPQVPLGRVRVEPVQALVLAEHDQAAARPDRIDRNLLGCRDRRRLHQRLPMRTDVAAERQLAAVGGQDQELGVLGAQ